VVILVAIMIVSADLGGRRLGRQEGRFESEEFNDHYTVRPADPKFASDVIHPRDGVLDGATAAGFPNRGRCASLPTKHDTQLISFALTPRISSCVACPDRLPQGATSGWTRHRAAR
jgi:hypothetical protein